MSLKSKCSWALSSMSIQAFGLDEVAVGFSTAVSAKDGTAPAMRRDSGQGCLDVSSVNCICEYQPHVNQLNNTSEHNKHTAHVSRVTSRTASNLLEPKS